MQTNSNSISTSKAGARNFALDYLRLIAMFLVVLLHVLICKKLLYYPTFPLSVNQLAVWLTESFAIIAVNLFVLLTGFFVSNHAFKWQKLILLAGEVIFTSWVLVVVFMCCGYAYTTKQLSAALFPISRGTYWFVTAYIGLYLLSPFINFFIQKASSLQQNALLIVCTLICCVWSNISKPAAEVLAGGGYTMLWLITLYLYGAYIRIHLETLKKLPLWLFGSSWAVAWLCTWGLSILLAIAHDNPDKAWRYNTPFNLLAAISCFMIFLKYAKPAIRPRPWLTKLSAAAFGVYIIHLHPFVFRWLWNDVVWFSRQTPYLFAHIFTWAVVIFFACLLLSCLLRPLAAAICNQLIIPRITSGLRFLQTSNNKLIVWGRNLLQQ